MVQWRTPKDFYGGKVALSADLNVYIRDNMAFLKSRPYAYAATGDVSTTSTTFVQVTNSSVSLTTFGGNLLYWACGRHWNSVGGLTKFDLAVDGIRQATEAYGTTLVQGALANYRDNINLFMITTTQIDAGTHACSLYWTPTTGTANANLYVNVLEVR